ncbi:MAG TPA: sugar phosphate nucleotidyltransferase [Kofleriaceae bacterium]|jgi:mannose-1-phosphate guanylyltransferase
MTDTTSFRTSAVPPTETDADVGWTLALSGGEGVRLSDYVKRRFGRWIPKQYCKLLGNRSMLEHTLERLNKLTPPERTFTVIGTNHADHALPQLAGKSDHVFRQPSSRDTGLALYVALAYIRRWTPNAIVTITPSDHYVAPSAKYIEQVKRAQGVATRLHDCVVILGAHPTEPDPELGYLTVGDALTEVPCVRRLTKFIEKPSPSAALGMIDAGALWNTMVTCGSIDALWNLGRATEPKLLDILDSFVPLVGSKDEDDAVEYIYTSQLPVSFSRDMLERAPERLAAMELDGVEWSDWGKPERIETVLALRRSRALVPPRVTTSV